MRSHQHVVRLHHKKEHPRQPLTIYQVDLESWFKLKGKVANLPIFMPPRLYDPFSNIIIGSPDNVPQPDPQAVFEAKFVSRQIEYHQKKYGLEKSFLHD